MRVGGTSSPAYTLVAKGGVATTGIVASIINPVSGGNSKIHFTDDATYNWTAGTVGNAFAITPSEASTSSGTPALYINSSSRVGIGTSSPSQLLQVSGGGILLSNAYYLLARNNANTLSLALIGRDSSDNVVIDPDQYGTKIGGTTLVTTSAGRVGIGTTSPGMKLTINDTTTAQIQLGYNDSIYGRIGRNSSGNYEFSSYENGGNLLFGTTGTTGSTTERARIDSSGRLGIGTSDPTSGSSSYYDDLVVRNATAGTGAGITIQSNSTDGFSGLNLRKADGTDLGKFVTDSSNGKLYIETAGSAAITVDSSQRVGIGSTSDPGSIGSRLWIDDTTNAYFTVNTTGSTNLSGIHFRNSNGNGEARLVNNTGGALTFYRTASVEAARIDTSGRLLVGTSSSSADTRVVHRRCVSLSYSGAGYTSSSQSIVCQCNGCVSSSVPC
jgi:hypothetical protein